MEQEIIEKKEQEINTLNKEYNPLKSEDLVMELEKNNSVISDPLSNCERRIEVADKLYCQGYGSCEYRGEIESVKMPHHLGSYWTKRHTCNYNPKS